MKHKIKPVMLPTEDKSHIGLYTDIRGELNIYYRNQLTPEIKTFFPQHLYITVSQDVEPIKEGDWYHNATANRVYKCNDDVLYAGANRKIIATDDPKLTSYLHGHNLMTTPQLQQSFLKEFVANPDGEYEVKYEICYDTPYIVKNLEDNTVNITSVSNSLKQELIKHLESNHIEASENRVRVIMKFIESITSVEEKMYSLKELTDAFDSAREFNSLYGVIDIHIISDLPSDLSPKYATVEDWIKEKLIIMHKPKCFCGAELESDGTCNSCGFDATECDIY